MATAVEDIGRDAGIAVNSIYHHFGGKDKLAAAVYGEPNPKPSICASFGVLG